MEVPEWGELSEAEQHRWHDTARDQEAEVLVQEAEVLVQEGVLHPAGDDLPPVPEPARVAN